MLIIHTACEIAAGNTARSRVAHGSTGAKTAHLIRSKYVSLFHNPQLGKGQ